MSGHREGLSDAKGDDGFMPLTGRRTWPIDKIVMPFAYVVAAIVFLLGLQHVIGLKINSCQVTHQGFTCSIEQLKEDINQKNDNAVKVFDEINQKIAALARRIDTTDATSGQPSSVGVNAPVVAQLNPNVVSDSLATYLRPIGGSAQASAPRVGAIFLGNNQDENSLSNLQTLAGTRLKFAELRLGQDYSITANLTLRTSLPANTPEYFSSVPSAGVLPKGTVVRLSGANPFETIMRNNIQQIWAEVQVTR